MMKPFTLWMLLLLGMLTACSDDKEYHYPSVKLEFLTAHSGADGRLTSITTDAGESYAVAQDDSQLKVGADSTLRIISQYEVQAEGVRLYAVGRPISPLPRPASAFKEGVVTDPVELTSAWMGLHYLNLIVNVREPQGRHSFHFVEEAFEESHLHLRLYHKAESSTQAYDQRVYLSIPLEEYLTQAATGTLQLTLTMNTYQGEWTKEFVARR